MRKYMQWKQPNWTKHETHINRGLWITIKSGEAILRGNTKGNPLDNNDEKTCPMCNKKKK